MAVAANNTQDAVDQLRSGQTTMQGQHEALMGGWIGNAATAFNGAFNEFSADYTKVIQALENLREKLSASQRNYVATEQANAQSATKISAALNR
jgi:WXG100 family type VII secretion target